MPRSVKENTDKVSSKSEEKPSLTRHFKILVNEIIPEEDSPQIDTEKLTTGGGDYSGKNPMQAAKKAFTRISKSSGKDQCVYIFSMQEINTTKDAKIFTYRGVREKLEKPLDVNKGESSFQVNFKTTVRSYKTGNNEKPVKKTKKVANLPEEPTKTEIAKISPAPKIAKKIIPPRVKSSK